jgi:NAD(P)H-hydrate epimerase
MTSEAPKLPPRPADGHKGTFGTVCVMGGQATRPQVMIGGPAFSTSAALRSGCGLAVLAVPGPLMAAALTISPSATGLALPVDKHNALKPSEVAELLDERSANFDCLAIGPGWGVGVPQQQILVRLLNQDAMPLVIDADAINVMAGTNGVQGDFRAMAVLTPHPGEYRRLAGQVGIQADPVDPESRPAAAEELARRLGCVVVLKGHGTVVSDGIHTVVNQTGNVVLATAGTGDVLTGMIAGIVAQHFKASLGRGSRQITAEQQGGLSLFDCARLGVFLHGLAADIWAEREGDTGMVAADLLELIPAALRRLQGDETA